MSVKETTELKIFTTREPAGTRSKQAQARDFSRRAIDSAESLGEKRMAPSYEADAAVREVLFGNATEVRQQATAALSLSIGRGVEFGATLGLAMTGDLASAGCGG